MATPLKHRRALQSLVAPNAQDDGFLCGVHDVVENNVMWKNGGATNPSRKWLGKYRSGVRWARALLGET